MRGYKDRFDEFEKCVFNLSNIHKHEHKASSREANNDISFDISRTHNNGE